MTTKTTHSFSSAFLNGIAVTGLMLLVGTVPTARAQDAAPPSDAQLQQPVAAAAAAAPAGAGAAAPLTASPTAAPTTDTVPMPGQAGDKAENTEKKPTMQNGQLVGDPCPSPSKALASSPDDLAKVQEEIDRFTLCVQRAQLLERLNDSTLKSDNVYDASLGLAPYSTADKGGAPEAPGLPGAQKGMPPLPDAALAGADVTPQNAGDTGAPVPDTAKKDNKAAPATTSSNDKAVVSDDTEAKEETPAWTIREIYGSGSGIKATLLSPDGDEVRVKEGEKLPNNNGVVTRITPTGVMIRDGKAAKALDWARS